MSVATHECPGPLCARVRPIDNRLFCCARDWFALSAAARSGISRTARAHILSPERRAAIEIARREWEAL